MALPIVQALGVLILLVLALLCYCSAARLKTQTAAAWFAAQVAPPAHAPAKAPLAPGAWLAGYRLEALLGHGHFGWVYRASAPDGAPVALKIVGNLEAGYDEALLLCHLCHSGVPWLEAGFPTPYGYCLVQEYVPGETLWARLHRCGGRLPVAEVLHLGGQLAATLADLHLHPQPILHQDVKPENAIVTPHGTVKLVDFGLAVLVGAGWLVRGGTRVYMAPEQRKGYADPRSDVYALGITLWELLAGACPRPELGQLPALPATCPLSLRRLLWQMVQVRYERRPSAWEVACALRGLTAQVQAGGSQRCA